MDQIHEVVSLWAAQSRLFTVYCSLECKCNFIQTVYILLHEKRDRFLSLFEILIINNQRGEGMYINFVTGDFRVTNYRGFD